MCSFSANRRPIIRLAQYVVISCAYYLLFTFLIKPWRVAGCHWDDKPTVCSAAEGIAMAVLAAGGLGMTTEMAWASKSIRLLAYTTWRGQSWRCSWGVLNGVCSIP